MRIEPSPLGGVLICHLRTHHDERGQFVNVWEASSAEMAVLDKCNLSVNPQPGTLRGMHWQEAPHSEHKLISCVNGSVFDVLIDVRPGPSYLEWWGMVLETPSVAIYVPPGFAHGYLTLKADSSVLYHMNGTHNPSSARGLRYDDPGVGIEWPHVARLVSARDAAFPLLASTT